MYSLRVHERVPYTRPCTSRVHGRVRAVYTAVTPPCTRAVYTPMYTACTRPCTRPSTRPSTRSCIWLCTRAVYAGCVHGRLRAVYTCTRPVLGHVQAMYTLDSCMGPEHETAVYMARIRPVYTAVYVPCTRVHGRVSLRSMYIDTAVYVCGWCARLRTWPAHGRVHGRVHDRVISHVHGPYSRLRRPTDLATVKTVIFCSRYLLYPFCPEIFRRP